MRSIQLPLVVSALVLTLGCGEDRADDDLMSAGATMSDDDGGDGGTDGGASGGGSKFDVGDEGGGGPGDGMPKGCDGVDFLFVIDHSASMGGNQDNLANSFPGFIKTIEEDLENQNHHIMVVDTDQWGGLGRGDWNQQNGGPSNGINCSPDPQCCDPAGSSCTDNPSVLCNGNICRMPDDSCDSTLGGGWTSQYPSMERCPIVGDQRFIKPDQPDLLGTFECMAKIGTWGNGDEQNIGSLLASLSPEMLGAGGCNEGFLRKDALLVVTIISDAAPASAWELHGEDPLMWHDDLVAAKYGDPNALVVLGLFNRDAGQYWQFISHFGAHGFSGDVEEADYTPFFREAIKAAGGISETCDEYVPPEG